MIKNRIALGVAALLTLGALSACLPAGPPKDPHVKPVPAGKRHRFQAVATITANSTTGPPLSIPLSMWADVTIVDGEHGVSLRNGHPYPDRWLGQSPLERTMTVTYWSGSNPTTFTFRATLDVKDIPHVYRDSPDRKFYVGCHFYKDDKLISERDLDDRSHNWAVVSVHQAATGAIRSIGVLCIWTDNAHS